MVQHRRQHHRGGEGHADTGADQRHHLGAVFLAREVGRQRHQRGGNRARALQRAAEDNAQHAVSRGRQQAAEGEYDQPGGDHRLAADAVGHHAEGDLQQRLGEAVDADRQPGEQGRGIGQGFGVEREHRQDQEQAEHAKGVNQRDRDACAPLLGAELLLILRHRLT